MAIDERRKKTRVNIKTKAELHTADGSILEMTTVNVSFDGVKLVADAVRPEYVGQTCNLKLMIPSASDALIIEFQCVLTRYEKGVVGVSFLGIGLDHFRDFENLVLSSAGNREEKNQLLKEINKRGFLTVSRIRTRLFQDELLQYISASIAEIFAIFLALEVKVVTPQTVNTADSPELMVKTKPGVNATAVVTFNGAFTGGIHLTAPINVALRLTNALAKEIHTTMDETSRDAYGELANMIAGGVQTNLSKEFENINLTPPTIITGSDYGTCFNSQFSSVKQFFQVDCGTFMVECFFSA